MTPSTAATLLATCGDPAKLDQLLRELGFTGQALALDELARERLGLPYGVRAARVAQGEGGLRALLLTVSEDVPPLAIVAKTARRFATRLPNLLWLVVVVQPQTSLMAIATWSVQTSLPRIAALLIDMDRVGESDAETVCALTTCNATQGDVLRHMQWLVILGREAVIQRLYRTLESMIGVLAESLTPAPPPADARQLALLCISRLLFLSFIETKGWLNRDCRFLINGFTDCMAHGGHYHRRVLAPLFFGTLHTRPTARALRAHAFGKIPFLNGGLFARAPLERRWRAATFSDDALGRLYRELIQRYRFIPRADPALWSDAVVDPQMLSNVFEMLTLAHGQAERGRRSGSWYTAQALVDRLVTLTLAEALGTGTVDKDAAERALAGELQDTRVRGVLLDRMGQLRIFDPYCGSGVLLVSALEQMAALRARLGDVRPIAVIRRSLLTTSIHGVDGDPMAVWLCQLRLWLSVVAENSERDPVLVLPLPNLGHKVRSGGPELDDASANATVTGEFDVLLCNPQACITTLQRSLARLTTDGALGLLLPAKLLRCPTGVVMRTFLQTHAQMTTMEDFSQSPPTIRHTHVTADPSILIGRRISACHPPSSLVNVVVHRAGASVKWSAPFKTLTFDAPSNSPWLLVPPPVRTALDNVTCAGTPLAHSTLGSIRRHDTNTHDASAIDVHVTWNDVGKLLRAAVLQPGDTSAPLNTYHAIHLPTLRDAYACATLLNAPLATAWLNIIAEPARGGLMRHLGRAISQFPVPRDWLRAREILAPLGERAARGDIPAADELHGATLRAYRLRADSVEPLLTWDIR